MRLLELEGKSGAAAFALYFIGSAILGVDLCRQLGAQHYSVMGVVALALGTAIAMAALCVTVVLKFSKAHLVKRPSLTRFVISDDEPIQLFFIGFLSLIAAGVGGVTNELVAGVVSAWELPLSIGFGSLVGTIAASFLLQKWAAKFRQS